MQETRTPFSPADFLGRQSWTTARARSNPHQYIVRQRVRDDRQFDAMVFYIRRHGRERVWGRRVYIVWYGPDGYHYWTMGWPVDQTTIINRAHSATQDQTIDVDPRLSYSSPNGSPPEGYRP